MVKTCCCCLSLETGAYIIGVIHLLSLVPEFFEFQLYRALLTIAGVLAFFYMLAYDGAASRALFFWVWMISVFSYFIISLFIATEEQGGFDPDARADRACEGID